MQQRCRSVKHNVFTEEVNKIALSFNDDWRTQSINSINNIYASETNEKMIHTKKRK